MSAFYNDQKFNNVDYTKQQFKKGEYDQCTFIGCNFQDIHISNCTFLECNFEDCNFTNSHWGGTSLQEISFLRCKMTGTDFSVCNPFMLKICFRESVLNLTNFIALPLQNTSFISCKLQEADFTEANLTSADFSKSILENTIFNQTNLENALFETAIDYTINPSKNKLKSARFSQNNLNGLLVHLNLVIS